MGYSVFAVGKKRPKKIIMPGDLGDRETRKRYKMPSGVRVYSIDQLPPEHPIRREIQMNGLEIIKKEADDQIKENGVYIPVENVSDFYKMPFKEAQYKVYRMVHGVTYLQLTELLDTTPYRLRKLMQYYGIEKNQDGTAILNENVNEPIVPKKEKHNKKKHLSQEDANFYVSVSPESAPHSFTPVAWCDDVIYRQELKGKYKAEILLQLMESLENTIISQPEGEFEVDISIIRRKGDILETTAEK